MKIITSLLICLLVCFQLLAQDTIHLTRKENNTVYLPDAKDILKPGCIVLLEGNYKWIKIANIQGTEEKPIIFINKGLVKIGGFRAYDCVLSGKYFKVLGNGSKDIKYGIQLNSGNDTSFSEFGLNLMNSSNVEVAYCEFTKVSSGILQNPKEGDSMIDCYYHNNYIHDLDNPKEKGRSEGFYLGNSHTDIPYTANFRFINCRIENNVLENLSGDGIQVKHGSFIIKGNVIKNHGAAKLYAQRSGILLGDNASGIITQNTVEDGNGVGLQILGCGDVEISYNQFIHLNLSELLKEDLWYINRKGDTAITVPKLKISAHDNVLNGSARYAINNATKIDLSDGSIFENNQIEGSFVKVFNCMKADRINHNKLDKITLLQINQQQLIKE